MVPAGCDASLTVGSRVTAITYDPIVTYGDWTEQRVTRATAAGGQPDFTFDAYVVRRGSGQREIGDTVVWLGRRVLVISTKARDFEQGQHDSVERAQSWLDGAIEKACRQIDGVVRAFRSAAPGDIELSSERGVVVPWDPTDVSEYLGLVVVNYSAPVGYVPTISATTPTIAIQAREWELILDEVRTTSGVFAYLEQRFSLGLDQPLGTEKEVLGLLGMAEYGEQLLVTGERTLAIPEGTFAEFRRRFPESELGHDPDDRLGFVIDTMIDQAHDMDPELTDISRIHDYLRVVEVLDSIPRRTRTPVGRLVFEKARLAREQERPRYFVTSGLEGKGRILFIAHPGDREDRREFLHVLTTLFHAKYLTIAADPAQAVTLGVATEPYPAAGRSHDYLLCQGEVWEENQEFNRQREELYPQYFPSEPA